MGLNVRRVHPEVIEHPDFDSGKMEFKPLINFSELTLCWFTRTLMSLNDGSILYMENESTALVHGHGCVDLRLDIVFDNISSAFMSTSKLNNSIIWHARLGYVHFKRIQDMLKDGSIPAFDMDTKNDLCGLHATPSLGIKKYFLTFIDDASRYDEHYKAFRDDIFDDESRLFQYLTKSKVPGNETEDFGGSVSGPKKGHCEEQGMRSLTNYPIAVMLRMNPKLFDLKQWNFPCCFFLEKKHINVEIVSSYATNTWMLDLVYLRCQTSGFCKWDFQRWLANLMYMVRSHLLPICCVNAISFAMDQVQVDLTKEFLSSRFSMKDIGEADVILVIRIKHEISTPMDTSEKLMPNNGQAVSQLEYSRNEQDTSNLGVFRNWQAF
ncbi:hypothetical protein Tco_0168084 [Tanacetum coccineum]